MSDKNAHGVIHHENQLRKDDYLYRISMKSLIRNNKGEVLVVKETGRTWWDLPGGGMDHKESVKEAIARELKEEVAFTGDFTYKIIAIDEPTFLEHVQVWQTRLIFQVVPTSMVFEPGEDGDEVMFINPGVFKDSNVLTERKIYDYWRAAFLAPTI